MGTDRRLVVALACVTAALVPAGYSKADAETGAEAGQLTRVEVIADIRELSDLIESAHPDPYANGGGRVAYHRRLQKLIQDVPSSGLEVAELRYRLERFVAAIGDAHTVLDEPQSIQNREAPGGIPLYFGVVEDHLYVSAVCASEYVPLIGSILESLEGVSVPTLLDREIELRSHDSDHHALSGLAGYGALYFGESLQRLLPEWDGLSPIRVELRRPSGVLEQQVLTPALDVRYPLYQPERLVQIPGRDRWFGYRLLDGGEVAYLWIDNMTTYRELFEYSRSVGDPGWQDWAKRVYERQTGETMPDDIDQAVAELTSATEVFQGLFRDMKASHTSTLIVDLEHNFGGNSLMVEIFLYFLVGFDRVVELSVETAEIQRMSSFFDASTESGVDFSRIPYSTEVPLRLGDYDFSGDSRFMNAEELRAAQRRRYIEMFQLVPTFLKVFSSRKDEALYKPRNLVVLSGNGTQSSGFDLMRDLRRLGATIVGQPSSQAGNSFGNIRRFELSYSRIVGWLATKAFIAYPGEAAIGYILEVDHQLTWERRRVYDFSPDAALKFALDLLAANSMR